MIEYSKLQIGCMLIVLYIAFIYYREGEDASFFLCKELIPGYLDGITGEYATPTGYLVDEQDAEEFDKQFPYKEKKKLPGQLF